MRCNRKHRDGGPLIQWIKITREGLRESQKRAFSAVDLLGPPRPVECRLNRVWRTCRGERECLSLVKARNQRQASTRTLPCP